MLNQDGFPVGLLEVATYEINRIQLLAGDTVVLFSDGVEEAKRGPKDFFGRERIAAAIVQNASLPLQGLHDGIRAALADFVGDAEPHDDATLLLLRYGANP